MMMSMTPQSAYGSFQFLQAKGNSWDGGKLKATMAERFAQLDKNHDGQISAEEAVASGGLLGQGNFALNSQTPNGAAIWQAIAGKNQTLSLRELTQLALYIDGTKSKTNPTNQMDGIATIQESNDVMADLSEATKNPLAVPKLYNLLDTNAEAFGLSKFIDREQEQVDSVRGEETTFHQDKAKTAELLEQSDMAVALIQTIIQQLLNANPTTPNVKNA
jgi:hypothetical protein